MTIKSETNRDAPAASVLPSSDYVIIGGTGDLALRKIFPALFWRYLDGQITADFRIVAASRHAIDKDAFAARLLPFCEACFTDGSADDASWDRFREIIDVITLDVVSGSGSTDLAAFIKLRADDARPTIFYLAIAPSLFGAATKLLRDAGLTGKQARLVVEKPLGHDGKSSRAINAELAEIFDESQIYRIDHYLGKETVQNLMALRFANVIFETQWNNNYIDHVQITVAETVGVGNRADYYDSYGAIRDMIQNHLLQLVCLVAMEPPAFFDADQVRDEKLRVLRAIRPLQTDDIMCGQYQEYASELGRNSNTETYAAMRLAVDNWRWAGVPFYIRTGKELARRASEIVITFKQRPHDVFHRNGGSAIETPPNRLIIRLQPSEGLRLQMISKQPGPGGMRLFPSELNLSFDDMFEDRLPDAYERLLMDTARGNQTLFMRRDEVFAAWDIIDPVLGFNKTPALYRSGTMGPPDNLAAHEGHAWIDPYDD
jgi:glucose-6-phosphate 1-dehydrogenase